MFYTKSLHPKCPTTPLWVEALFYLCCVGTGTGQLPPVHTNYSDTSEAWIGNSVSYLNWTQILHKYLHTFSNITQIFTHFLQVLMVYKKVYNVSRKYQENWNKEHPINNQQKSHPFNVSDKYHVCLGSKQPPVWFQALAGCLKPTTDPETLSKDHKGVLWSLRPPLGILWLY